MSIFISQYCHFYQSKFIYLISLNTSVLYIKSHAAKPSLETRNINTEIGDWIDIISGCFFFNTDETIIEKDLISQLH